MPVHGLDDLRVVDASGCRDQHQRPSIKIAEKGAAMVKDAAAKTGGGALGIVVWPLSGYR